MRTRISLSLILAALVAFPAGVRGQGVGFAQSSFPTGNGPAGVAVGDFNGDGKLDLAIANIRDNTVSILLGDGKGGFSAKVDFPTASAPNAVAVGDFNGDGKLDLAVACGGAGVVSILLGNGNATFAPKTDFATGNTPTGIVVADFNGDGKLDLATANQDADTVSVLLGQGNGTFAAHADFATGQNPVAILADDFNGDGKPDLATANRTTGTVSVLLGHGDGTFGQKTDLLTDTNPVALASADFRNILKRDLVTVNFANSTASVLLGNGNGTFNPRTDLGVDTSPMAVTAADFNADGKMDFAAATGFYTYCGYYGCSGPVGRVSLRLGDGSGGFTSTFSFPTGFIPSGIAQGDFNGDGRIDLAVTNATDNMVFILLQAPAANLNPATLAFNNFQIVGTTSAPQTVQVSSTGSFPVQVSTVVLTGSNAGEFHVTADSCSGASMPAGNACAVSVDFAPTTVGGKAVSLTFNSNAVPQLPVVALAGGGVPNAPVASFSTPILAFPPQSVGTTSTPAMVAFSNTGGLNLTYTSIALSGPNTADFAFAPDPAACSRTGGSLAPGASCNLTLVFTPSAAGNRSATISITDNALGSPQMVPLIGTGTLSVPAVTLTPPSVTFSTSQIVGTMSGSMPVTLMNSGTAALTITSIAASGDYAQTNSCPVSPATLAAGVNCTITITFTPTATATRTGAITIINNAAGSPHTVMLSGVGASGFTLMPASGQLALETIAAGSTAVFSFTFSNPSGAAGTINFTCSGVVPSGSCQVAPISISALTANPALQLSVRTTARSSLPPRVRPPRPGPSIVPYGTALGFLLFLLLVSSLARNPAPLAGASLAGPAALHGMRFATRLAFAVLLLGSALEVACGGGGASSSGVAGTPQGTYPITVTGTAGTSTQNINFTLQVN